jgi:hypothetical protein
MTQMMTSAELRAEAARCRRIARAVNDPATKSRLGALASQYAAEADVQEAREKAPVTAC